MQEIEGSVNPFPGLRPFESSETHLFFGRDGQSEELLRRLRRTRFLAVVGTSGSGKSSLVRAGLLPALQGGLMAGAGADWRIAILRPGDDPIGNLASALASPLVLGDDEKSADIQTALAETTLRRSSLGLVEFVSRARTNPHTDGQPLLRDYENLLIVVDQFEELFRFKELIEEENSREDAAAFVKLLLEAAGQSKERIYIVLTMRSDFLGDCSQFWGLPEAINDGQYLIPRMTRDERREAITGPVAVGGGTISDPLVNQLLNDVGDNPDQLPILQHALMRTWDYWINHRRNGKAMDIQDYDDIGGMGRALSLHADKAYDELDDAQKVIAEKLFKGLTERGADNREIRRPMEVGKICELTGASEAEVISVIEVFRRKGRSFLMPPSEDPLTGAHIPLTAESLIDISHESLIRNWERLKKWVEAERESAGNYRRLAETAVLHSEKGAGLWRDPDLQIALRWKEKNKPNITWARRYHPEFELAMDFLDESVRARDKQLAADEARRKTTRLFVLILALALAASLFMFYDAYKSRNKAEVEAQRSKQLLYVADINLAWQAFESNNLGRGLELLKAHLPNPREGDAPGFEWYYLYHLYHQDRATLGGHKDKVLAVAYSRDGKIATGSRDSTVKLWDAASYHELATLRGHADAVTSLAFSPDRNILATGSRDTTVKLWDTASYHELTSLHGHAKSVTSLAYSRDGKILATGSSDGTVKLWDTTSNQELPPLRDRAGAVASVAFSPDGSTLFTITDNGTVMVWDVASREGIIKPPAFANALTPMALSRDGKTLATGDDGNTVKLWDTTTRQALATLRGHTGLITSVAYSPTGEYLATGSGDNTVKLWHVASRQEVAMFKGHAGDITSITFSPDGKTIVTGSDDETAKVWDIPPHWEPTMLTGHTNAVTSVAFSPRGRMLATAGRDNTVRLWDTTSNQALAILRDHNDLVFAVAFSPDGKMLATASSDKTALLWDTASGQLSGALKGHTDAVTSVAFSPDGKILATGSNDDTVRLWDAASYRQLATLTSRIGDVTCLAYSPDGRILAMGGIDKRVVLWDTTSHQELGTLTGPGGAAYPMAFSPDGKILATGSSNNTVKLWDIASRKEATTLEGHTDEILSIAYSPDGKTLAIASWDGTVKLWAATSHQELIVLKGHNGGVFSVAFSPDSRMLATGGNDNNVGLWRGATDAEVAAGRK
ncbi:MAG TPA: hypothetical protein VF735_18905 [Pyrinomonadaceae bacterium]|jgi:WD40 repeat protein